MSSESGINPSSDRLKSRVRLSWPIAILLIAVLAVGAYFRFVGLHSVAANHLRLAELGVVEK